MAVNRASLWRDSPQKGGEQAAGGLDEGKIGFRAGKGLHFGGREAAAGGLATERVPLGRERIHSA